MACRNCECGCADNIKPIHIRYLDWELWKEINSHKNYHESSIYNREVEAGKSWIFNNLGNKYNIEVEINNYTINTNQPENTVQMIFYGE